MRIIFQDDEADSVERVLHFILENKELCDRIFKSGHERRNCRRIAMKIKWSRIETEPSTSGEAA